MNGQLEEAMAHQLGWVLYLSCLSQPSINQCATNTWHVDQGNEASVAVASASIVDATRRSARWN
jgi:hypothetical protein